MNKRRMGSLVMAIAGMFPLCAKADECGRINLLYNERPPYQVTTSRGVAGITATMVNEVFQNAQIDARWALTPVVRQFKMLEANLGCDCMVGVFRSREREAYARFTDPLFRDQQRGILIRGKEDRIQPNDPLVATLRRRDLVLEVKAGYSYGEVLDRLLNELKPRMDSTTGENDVLASKILAERGDYMFVTPQEADALRIHAGLDAAEAFRWIPLSGMPLGDNRHIMCSRRVGEQTIDRLNKAISKVRKSYPDTR